MNNKTDILNELKEISPALAALKENEEPLFVPLAYFEQLADSFIAEIKTESGVLSSIKKEKTEVPAGYFNTFADTVVSKIKAEENTIQKGKIIALPKQENNVYRLFKRVALAASIVGAVFLVKEVEKPAVPVNDCKDGIACLTKDEIYNYMNEHSPEFDIQQIQETVKPVLENTSAKTDIDKKEATQYIEQNKTVLDVEDAATDIF